MFKKPACWNVHFGFSKALAYKFHYDYIKNKFDNNSRILFTYDNSLINEIESDDLYEDFRSNK